MIYFKFPFDEKLYSTDKNHDQTAVLFKSFDQAETIGFNGNIIEVTEIPDTFSGKLLSQDDSHFSAETHEEYLDKLQKAIEVIKKNQLPKLVLSRRKIFTNFNEIDLKKSFHNLCAAYPNAFRYIFIADDNAWMGAFSEVLGKFNKSTHEFETMSLAGTIPTSESWTDKEIEEQKPVSSYIRNVLEKFSTQSEIQESETYDHISGNIKHLKTDFKLKIKPEDLEAIIEELHPTPAVCGIPKEFCKEKIQELEKFPRELYAGFIRIETDEFIQYFVNLRCAKLYSDAVHLFVGGGITAQSNPEKEWIETELKSEAVLKNLSFLN
ncbi:Isochorismate synthase EntC [Chryseobacterium aquaeductus]|uniref:Isochorismate synthase EntC n=1 Tax=Chryseobacterium aquaeductus TaxID=2675056 RepID=A0A9N8MRD1_9FLAO|nr:chorismate-binding protein [Chryseobacterium aquaeductus]CAA7329887.1 Isochorismate synthase EntC [Chryseobacterium potabilaquae]CAA7332539.1 Isochorismate synthase EntC [Chryseobacterium potabilaquae]CAA7332543.1 Isochorismate synthase EntC [Chryseobacterium potabilaquae]CAD7799780.1 Isochorismate synthase EntC [Chryseobacterium aquaeductus]CAD7823555.1 Isochorismate synthase EntC [Chryseobacterium aquaeductus]